MSAAACTRPLLSLTYFSARFSAGGFRPVSGTLILASLFYRVKRGTQKIFENAPKSAQVPMCRRFTHFDHSAFSDIYMS